MRYAIVFCLLVTVGRTPLLADELNFPTMPSPPELPVATKPISPGPSSAKAISPKPGKRSALLPRPSGAISPKMVKPSLDPSRMVLPSASEIQRSPSGSEILPSETPKRVSVLTNGQDLTKRPNQLEIKPATRPDTRSATSEAVQNPAGTLPNIAPHRLRPDIEPAFSRIPRSVPPAPRSLAQPTQLRTNATRGTLPPPPANDSNPNTPLIPLLEDVSPPVGSGLADPLGPNTYDDPTTVPGDQFVDVLKSIELEQNAAAAPIKAIVGRLQIDRAPFAVFETQTNEPVQQDSEVPQLRVSTIGPNTLVVGRSARYTISLNNLGDFDATEVQLRCSIPEWVSLDETQSSGGRVATQSKDITWDVDVVPAKASQKLVLDLTPRAGKAFELNVDIAVQPSQSKKQISIQEPKLAVKMTGPTETIYNQPALWQIEITNPGTGDANDVQLDIFAGQQKLDSQPVGTIPAGETRNATLEITASEAGTKDIRAIATGNPGIRDEAITDFVCRRGRVSLALTGPEVQYAGSNSDYQLTIENTGDADLSNVMLNLELPSGITYVSGLPSPSETAGGVSWFADRLAAGETKQFPIKLSLVAGGVHEINASATTADDLTASATTRTESRTAADLKLVVSDPVGPQSLGSLTEYVIEVTNRGTAPAREIEIIAVCAPELDPVDVDGNAAIQSGQIFFKPLADLPADHKVTYTVKARATKPGTHAFRVIVKSYQPDLRLATEEQTQFFDRNSAPVAEPVIEEQDATEEEMASRPVELISKEDREERSY